MRAGTLRDRFTVYTVTRGAEGSLGAPSVSTSSAGSLWGRLEPKGGREARSTGANLEEVDYVVTVRATDADEYDLDASDTYLVLDETSETLNVEAVLRDSGRNAERVLLCKVSSQDGAAHA